MSRLPLLLLLALTAAPAEARYLASVYWGGYCVNGNGFCVFAFDSDDGAVRMIDPFENRTSIDEADDGILILRDWTDASGAPMTATYTDASIDFSNGLQWSGTRLTGDAFEGSRCANGLGICVVLFRNGVIAGVLTEAREYSDATLTQVNGVHYLTATRWNKTATLLYDSAGEISAVQWQNGTLWTR